MSPGAMNSKFEKLNGKNYFTWKMAAKAKLTTEKVWKHFKIDNENAPKGTEEEREIAFATLVQLVCENQFGLIEDCQEDPKKAWDKVVDHYEKVALSGKLTIKRRLANTRWLDNESLSEYVEKVKFLLRQLVAAGETKAMEELINYVIAGLPNYYDELITALETKEESELTEQYVFNKIQMASERRLESKASGEQSKGREEKVLAATKKFKGKCHHCRKPGHKEASCWKKHGKPGSSNQKSNEAAIALGALYEEVEATSAKFIIDSGASKHFVGNKDLLDNYQTLAEPFNVSGISEHVQALGVGTLKGYAIKMGNQKVPIRIEEVYYVPQLRFNLLSVNVLIKKGVYPDFKNKRLELHGHQELPMRQESGTWSLEIYLEQNRGFAAKEETLLTWHRRFGHVGMKQVRNTLKAEKITFKDGDNTCETCIATKMAQTAFGHSETKTTRTLELVHSDLCGPVKPASRGGNIYFVTFIDDFSKYWSVHLLQKKSDTFEEFLDFEAKATTKNRTTIETFRSDNGGEFANNLFTKHFRANGTNQEFTVPDHPQQNGKAERANRTILEGTRALLKDSGLPKEFWGEALNTFIWTRNNLPRKDLNGKTPSEVFLGRKAKLEDMHVFGAKCYYLVVAKNRGKLDDAAKVGKFLGYDMNRKGFRVLNENGTVQLARTIQTLDKKKTWNHEVSHEEISEANTLEGNENHETLTSEDPEEDEDILGPIIKETNTKNSDTVGERRVDEEPNMEINTRGTEIRRNTRPKRQSRIPVSYDAATGSYYSVRRGLMALAAEAAAEINNEPQTYEDAMRSPNQKHWDAAIKKELDSLEINGTWVIAERPKGRKTVKNKWVFKVKRNANGSIERYKARLVAKGFTQEKGIDYDETFSPVISAMSLRLLLAYAVENDYIVEQLDVDTAFLIPKLTEEIYMELPEGYHIAEQDRVLKLKKSIYGLKQSSRNWNEHLVKTLVNGKFKQSTTDACVLFKEEEDKSRTYVTVYVDDLLIMGQKKEAVENAKKLLREAYSIKELGNVNWILGIKIRREKTAMTLDQELMANTVLRKFGMENCNPSKVPIPNGLELKSRENEKQFDLEKYRSAVGSLMYLATMTRPDLTYAVSLVARHMHNPTEKHWNAIKGILRYIRGTTTLGLKFEKSGTKDFKLEVYSDADFGGDCETRRSTSGTLVLFNKNTITWSSKRQNGVTMSTAEAEYVAASISMKHGMELSHLIDEIIIGKVDKIIRVDNQAAIKLMTNEKSQKRTKHIDIKYHYAREKIQNGDMNVLHVASGEMLADLLTKAMPAPQFIKLRNDIGLVHIQGEC